MLFDPPLKSASIINVSVVPSEYIDSRLRSKVLSISLTGLTHPIVLLLAYNLPHLIVTSGNLWISTATRKISELKFLTQIKILKSDDYPG